MNIFTAKIGVKMFEEKIKEIIGHELPTAPKPLAAYIPTQISGKVVETVAEETAILCARQSAVNCLSAVKSVIGDLEKIDQIVKLTVFVNSSNGFSGQPKIANGASEFLVQVFGEQGKHARSAVGVSELPLNAPVEIEMIVRIK